MHKKSDTVRFDLKFILLFLLIIKLVSCTAIPLSVSTPTSSPTTTPTKTSTPSPTATITPNFTATQKAVELKDTQIAQETQNEIFAQETQVADQTTSHAEATKQAQEAVENQKVNAYLNQVRSEFFTNKDLTISTKSSGGELHFSDKLMGNKNLDNWELTNAEAYYFLNHLFGLIVTNLAEDSSDPRIVKYKGLNRKRNDLVNSNYFVNIAKSVKKDGPLLGWFCNSGQCIEGEFEGINIWFGRYKQVDEFRQLALDNNVSIVDGLNSKDISKSFPDTNSFMVIGNQQVYIFAGSLVSPIMRSQPTQSTWEFERVNWEATVRNLRCSFSWLIVIVSSSISYNAYPADIQNKILDLENWIDFGGYYLRSFITQESFIHE